MPERSKKRRNLLSSSASSNIDTLRNNPCPIATSSRNVWGICEFQFYSILAHLRFSFAFSVAGSDTSSTTITYILWELSRRPDILKKLQAELDEAMPDSKAIPDISVLNELPYLNGVVKEGTLQE